MDDKNFDEQTALDWIQSVEGKRNIRESDIFPKLTVWMEKGKAQRILDIGCGQGFWSNCIDLSSRNYTGVDPSPFMIKRATELYATSNRTFEVGNAYMLAFPDESFDSAFSVLVWHLLGDIRLAAQELSRVLKPRGKFFIVTANPTGYSAWMDLYTDSKLDGIRFEGTMKLSETISSHDVLYLHSFHAVEEALLDNGLRIDTTATFRKSTM